MSVWEPWHLGVYKSVTWFLVNWVVGQERRLPSSDFLEGKLTL